MFLPFFLAELETIAVSLPIAINLGHSRIVAESYSKSVVDLILSGEQCFNECGLILQDIAFFF